MTHQKENRATGRSQGAASRDDHKQQQQLTLGKQKDKAPLDTLSRLHWRAATGDTGMAAAMLRALDKGRRP